MTLAILPLTQLVHPAQCRTVLFIQVAHTAPSRTTCLRTAASAHVSKSWMLLTVPANSVEQSMQATCHGVANGMSPLQTPPMSRSRRPWKDGRGPAQEKSQGEVLPKYWKRLNETSPQLQVRHFLLIRASCFLARRMLRYTRGYTIATTVQPGQPMLEKCTAAYHCVVVKSSALRARKAHSNHT